MSCCGDVEGGVLMGGGGGSGARCACGVGGVEAGGVLQLLFVSAMAWFCNRTTRVFKGKVIPVTGPVWPRGWVEV